MDNLATRHKIAKLLVEGHFVAFDFDTQYRWASGLRSPMYCDCRGPISQPRVRDEIVATMLSVFRDEIPGTEKCSLIAGVATAAIPWATILADRSRLPLVYVRPGVKDHGTQKLIEGTPAPGGVALLIEDTISTGRSLLASAQTLRDVDVSVACCLSIMNYEFSSTAVQFESLGLRFYSLTDFHAVTEASFEGGLLTRAQANEVLQWWGKVAKEENENKAT